MSRLASCCNVRMLASIDHMNAHALWDKELATSFNWCMQDATTFRHYDLETWEIPFVIAGRKEEKAKRGASVVLRTLVPNAREIFCLIAKDQLDEENHRGFPLPELFRLCRERFLLSSELTLKSHLNEFRDHQLVATKKGPDGNDVFYIPMANDEIEKVLDEIAAN